MLSRQRIPHGIGPLSVRSQRNAIRMAFCQRANSGPLFCAYWAENHSQMEWYWFFSFVCVKFAEGILFLLLMFFWRVFFSFFCDLSRITVLFVWFTAVFTSIRFLHCNCRMKIKLWLAKMFFFLVLFFTIYPVSWDFGIHCILKPKTSLERRWKLRPNPGPRPTW